MGRSRTEKSGGLYSRENAGMSSESHARNMAVVGDGQQVEIPALPRNEAVTQKDSSSAVMVNCVKVSSVGRS